MILKIIKIYFNSLFKQSLCIMYIKGIIVTATCVTTTNLNILSTCVAPVYPLWSHSLFSLLEVTTNLRFMFFIFYFSLQLCQLHKYVFSKILFIKYLYVVKLHRMQRIHLMKYFWRWSSTSINNSLSSSKMSSVTSNGKHLLATMQSASSSHQMKILLWQSQPNLSWVFWET